MAYFDKRCSKILDGLYVGSEYVAKTLSVLQQHGITHVINCVGSLYPEYFAGQIRYLTLYLRDAPQEDITCVFNDCFDFIDKARRRGGRVLVHCSQGVSRSATIAIAYVMWKTRQTYETALCHVKNIRGVVNPNIGFTCALMYWQKRRSTAVKRCRMFRLAPHCPEAPSYIVPKAVSHACPTALDSRGAFVIAVPGAVYVWVGSQADAAFAEAAKPIAERICRYDNVGTTTTITVVAEGQEPQPLTQALSSEDDGADSASGSLVHPAEPFLDLPRINPTYDADFNILDVAAHQSQRGTGDGGRAAGVA